MAIISGVAIRPGFHCSLDSIDYRPTQLLLRAVWWCSCLLCPLRADWEVWPWKTRFNNWLKNAPELDPRAYQGDCKIHGAKLPISSRGGVSLWDKVPGGQLMFLRWKCPSYHPHTTCSLSPDSQTCREGLTVRYSWDIPTVQSSIIQQCCKFPHPNVLSVLILKLSLLNSQLPRDKEPVSSPCIPPHSPRAGLGTYHWVTPWR